MRKTDASKSVTRSDLVWLSLAVDYIGKRLRTGEATSKDFFSFVELGGDQKYLMDWILYNNIIDFLRSHQPCGEGNYLPAIDKAQSLLSYNRSGKCALQLIFLSDGAPSDFKGNQEMCKYEAWQFSTLEEMVKTAEEYNCQGFLMKASLRVEDLSSAFCQMSTLITDTKTTMTDFKTNSQRTFRDLIREPKSAIRVYVEKETAWKVYTNLPGSGSNVVRAFFDKEKYLWTYPERTFESYSAVGIAVRDYIFGEGKERAVRRVREVNSRGQFVGTPLVGKETLFQEDLDPHDVRAFHKNFCKLQQLAKKYARYFNRKLLSLPGIDRSKMPTIQFLDCWVMLFNKENNERGAILVEKMLDHEKYMKWNTNDIPQAFSHFTYNASGRRFLVCDLQGVLDMKKTPPVFELTDPAIHYSEQTRRSDFGRTDKGENGIDQFFQTHTCSDLCRMVCRQWVNAAEDDVIQYESIRGGQVVEEAGERETPEEEKKSVKRVKFAL
ncbi:alpha kinase family protein [Skeletonema marinoi]|uniref:Alpha kinase family protein n=1 Tax=Skeletonema marinoi TaxID=267567 RepID=A0AAD9D7C6_9STRA|nr:alpha kinase family protein [Skeletonema marinoi]